jgi:dsRNA-specific ribonuclease
MNNPSNQLITKDEVERILNYFENIGDNGDKLTITNLEYFQRAFVHESYYQSVQNYMLNISSVSNDPNASNTNNVYNVFNTNTVESGGGSGHYLHYIPIESNERLEYLGDHILKAVMGRYLYERFSDEREGFLTKLKIKIEKCSMLHKFGLTLGFKKFLLLSLQIENQTILDIERGRNTPSYYEDVFEAFIGSIILDFGDKGYIYAEKFVRSVIENVIDFAELISKNDNFKDSLQRYFQSIKWKTPQYTTLYEQNPLYRKVFVRMLTLSKEQYSSLPESLQKKVAYYNQRVLREYKHISKEVFTQLLQIQNDHKVVLGLGSGRKVVDAEQDCARQSLVNLDLSLNY